MQYGTNAVSKSPLVGCFFSSYDGTKLYHIVGQVNPHYVLVEEYEGLQLTNKKLWPVPKITGFKLYPTLREAIASDGGAK
jgi:hypothetical protein